MILALTSLKDRRTSIGSLRMTIQEMKSIPLAWFLLFIAFSNTFSQENSRTTMVIIPGGEFTMGSSLSGTSDWQPAHRVLIDSFLLDTREVSNKEYYAFCKATGHRLPEFWGKGIFRSGPEYPDHPVTGVSYLDAMQYSFWSGKRLPTEAEWEFAARGGLIDKNYPFGDRADSTQANYGKKFGGTTVTGSFPPNGYGLYDMSGNVWEWVSDFYSSDYYMASPLSNPRGPEKGSFRVIRGGSWHSGAMCVQNFYRYGLPPHWIDFAVGFRCASDL